MTEQIANHSEQPKLPLRLNLQYFADGEEDLMFPDDFGTDLPQSEEIADDVILPDESTDEAFELEADPVDELQQEEQLESQQSEQPRFKVKFNHEEQEIGYDEAVPLIQKGMNYDKLQERLGQLETDPRLSFVEELAQEQGMNVEEYLQAVKQHREQQQLDALIQQNIPQELAQEIMENKKFRDQYETEQKSKQEEATREQEFKEFFSYFQQANGRNFDPSKDQIPQEVWDMKEQGMPLKFAFMQHHNQQLQSQLNTFKQKEQNTKRAPGLGVTQFGGDNPSSEDPFLKGFESI